MAKILIVDDEVDIVSVMEEYLTEQDHTVFSAYDGPEAIEKAIEVVPDLVLLDINMPTMTGIEVCQTLRSNPETQLIPIVIVTGQTDDVTYMEAISAGCDDFLSKPLNIPILQARVDSLLKLSRLRNQIREKEKLEYMVNNMSDGLVITDKDGLILRVNSTAAQIFNLDVTTLPDAPFLKLIETRFGYKPQSWDDIISKQHGDFIMRIHDQFSDLIFAVSIKYDTLVNPFSEIEEVIFISSEVTERERAQKKLEEALDQARQANRVKTLFLANVSHEFRTPLNAILGFVEIIEHEVSDFVGPEELGHFEIIQASGKRLMRTVHEVLDISQLETGTFELGVEKLDLSKLIETVFNDLQPRAQEKGLLINYISEINNSTIEADEYCVSQAITNLIDNAIKYTEKGKVEISLREIENRVIITVEDTGIGMSEEYLTKVFDPFTQESEGYTKKFQGLGLGLALTKRYIELNEGEIMVESKKGCGTTFTVIFDLVAAEAITDERIEPEAKDKIAPAKKPLILVVDDDVHSQKLVSFYLHKEFELCFATSVAGAKEQLGKNLVELILLDLTLEGDEDGLELTKYVRQTEKLRDIPIIALTAHAFAADREKCLASGCNDYLAKPFKKQELLDKIIPK